ncbi:MAG: PEP/pyruvate-binding domain-containing protein [Bacteroidota bacterium]
MRVFLPGIGPAPGEALLGAKGENLARMLAAGHAVPPFFVITSEAFTETVGALDGDVGAVDHIAGVRFPDALGAEIEDAIAAADLGDAMLAVRSSAIGEDGAGLSFAGQLASFLFVRREEVLEAVRNVWASAFSQRAVAYRRNNGVEGVPRVAVVVQRMINADTSGVAFGIDPISGDRDAVVISAVPGLGEGLVSGELDADTFLVTGGAVRSTIAVKSHRVVVDRAGGSSTMTEDLPEPLRRLPALTGEWTGEIARVTKSLNRLFGRPQDVEWCIAGGVLYLLQSRPVTNLAAIPADTRWSRILWDNSNIIESYSGVTTPLTFSFVRDVYTEVYKDLCRILGVDEESIEGNAEIFQMLGLIGGRIYYNLLNWYRVLALLPGYSINAGFMEGMMGVRERLEEVPAVRRSGRNPYMALGLSLYRLVTGLVTLPKKIVAFQEHLNITLLPFESRTLDDLSAETPEALIGHYHLLEYSLLRRWRIPILNDFYTMIFFGLLKRTVEKWMNDAGGTIHNDLLAGEGGIISTEPLRRLRALANGILADEALTRLILHGDETEAARVLLDESPFAGEARAYLTTFGDRYVGELKLETITMTHDHRLLVRYLAGYLNGGHVDVRDDSGGSALRSAAERRARKEIRGALRKGLFGFILRQARQRVKNRENLRFERTRVFAVVRKIFLAIGARLSYEGIIDGARDIFFLTKEEIFSYVNGTAVTADLRGLVALRRREFAAYETSNPADRFFTHGMVYHGNSFAGERSVVVAGDGDFTGTPCSPGIVRGRIRKVIDPGTAPPLGGAILVAERTDPGWAPLFPTAGALLVERGSLLSHSAIVAREMGIPAIVGIDGLMERLIEGEEVEMDGSTGIIRLFRNREDG